MDFEDIEVFRPSSPSTRDILISSFPKTIILIKPIYRFGEWLGKPGKFNSEECRSTVSLRSKWKRFVWGCSTGFVLFVTLLQASVFGFDVATGNLHMENLKDFIRVIYLIITMLTVGMIINEVIMYSEFVEFLNTSLTYLKLMAVDRIIVKPHKFDRLCQLQIIAMGGGIGGIWWVGIIMTTFFCELNPFSAFLPICKSNQYGSAASGNALSQENGFSVEVLLSLIVVVGYTACQVCTILSIGVTLIIAINGCDVTLAALRKSRGTLRDPNRWSLHYTCMQLLFNRVAIFIGKYLISIFLLGIGAWVVFMNYGIIRFELSPLILLMTFVIYTAIIVSCYIIVYRGSALSEISEQVLDLVKHNVDDRKEQVFYLWLRAQMPYKIPIGRFSYFKKESMSIFLCGIIEYTVNLLLTF